MLICPDKYYHFSPLYYGKGIFNPTLVPRYLFSVSSDSSVSYLAILVCLPMLCDILLIIV